MRIQQQNSTIFYKGVKCLAFMLTHVINAFLHYTTITMQQVNRALFIYSQLAALSFSSLLHRTVRSEERTFIEIASITSRKWLNSCGNMLHPRCWDYSFQLWFWNVLAWELLFTLTFRYQCNEWKVFGSNKIKNNLGGFSAENAVWLIWFSILIEPG